MDYGRILVLLVRGHDVRIFSTELWGCAEGTVGGIDLSRKYVWVSLVWPIHKRVKTISYVR